ncbi:hypothetical protein CI781_15125 [Acinetobacter baumannii]|nr:hypothetical protein CEB37_13955 [Acinetobacter baumannii]OYM51595.1 hypothetical protein CI655_08785 [Acinetobacter baumannii]OYM52081.1 hypothetical protein CI742_14680 [Acinetobacter baumannii]OYM64948.1 hypothetical protein CI657_03865 [Acinetobacter baumannii]OYM75615.1 hypothetical protein CI743_16595 [Acinetobacter baumannii]
MRRSIAYRQIFHQCFNATCIFTNATSSLNFVNRLRTINRSILLKYQAIMLLYPVGTLLAKNIYHLCTRQISQNPYPIRVLPS